MAEHTIPDFLSPWDQKFDIESLEEQLRAREGRERLDSEIEHELRRIRNMFEDARRRLGLHHLDEQDQ